MKYYDVFDTNSMIEEFMLLANVSVGEKILSTFPSVAVLRHHDPPKADQILEFKRLMNQIGYEFDYSTSKTLNESLEKIRMKDNPFFNKLIKI